MPSPFIGTGSASALCRLVAAAACTVSATAFADCTSRAAKPAEAVFHARAVAALVAALPPLPAGVAEVDAKAFDFKNPPAIYDVLCDFSKEGEFSVSAKRKDLQKRSQAERQPLQAQYDTLTAQVHALKKTPPDVAAEVQAWRQKANAAWQATRDPEKAGDKAAAQTRDAEYRALRNQADAIPGAYLPTSARGGADVCTRGRSARRAPHGDVGTGNGPAAPRRPRPDQQRSRRSVGARTRRHADRRPCAVGAPGCGAG